jgi:thiol-disulfide isomerase/thioredoxin
MGGDRLSAKELRVNNIRSFPRLARRAWTGAAIAAAIGTIALAQPPGSGASAPPKSDKPTKPGAPSASPGNTAPKNTDKPKPSADTKAKGPELKAGEAVPEWKLKDGDGKEHALKDLRGKVVLLDYWATWCGPCKQMMPEVQKLHETYADHGLVAIGMNASESQGKVTEEVADARAVQFKHDNKYTYLGLLRADEAAKAYHVTGIPAFFLIGPDGKLINHWVGGGPRITAEINAAVKQALDGLAKSGTPDANKPVPAAPVTPGATPEKKDGGK